ncbi:MAG: hypothetical protein H6599_09385 [Flavobacteriales bacterium]|nr:hypothetical protein [Flavobacteriales bacterium]
MNKLLYLFIASLFLTSCSSVSSEELKGYWMFDYSSVEISGSDMSIEEFMDVFDVNNKEEQRLISFSEDLVIYFRGGQYAQGAYYYEVNGEVIELYDLVELKVRGRKKIIATVEVLSFEDEVLRVKISANNSNNSQGKPILYGKYEELLGNENSNIVITLNKVTKPPFITTEIFEENSVMTLEDVSFEDASEEKYKSTESAVEGTSTESSPSKNTNTELVKIDEPMESEYSFYFNDISNGDKLICFFSPNCENCKAVGKKIVEMKEQYPNLMPEVRILFMDESGNNSEEEMDTFLESIGANYEYRILSLDDYIPIFFAEYNFPGVKYLHNGEEKVFFHGTEKSQFDEEKLLEEIKKGN